MKKILIYGIGNLARQDDALGILFVEEIKAWAEKYDYNFIDTDCNYQLNIEDAAQIVNYDTVIFVDASIDERVKDCLLELVDLSDAKLTFSTHSASPNYIVFLCKQMFNVLPASYIMHIRGYSFEFAEKISPEAKKNLQKALQFLTKWIVKNYL